MESNGRAMAVDTDRSEELNPAHTWRPLRLFNIYRLVLASFFVILGFSEIDIKPIGEHSQTLFNSTSLTYLLLAIIICFTIRQRNPAFTTQAYSQTLIDIIAITLLMHASGGTTNGLGMLLIVAVTAGAVLLSGRAALSLAAIATLAILGEHIYFQLDNPQLPASYTHTGLLGATFFITSLLARALAQRIRESEALAARRGIDLANMQQLAEYVIQRMQTGIVVIDSSARIWQINDSARLLLGIAPLTGNPPLATVCPALAAQYQQWRQKPDSEHQRLNGAVAELLPRFASLGDESSTLIFIEDTTALTQQAQQLKLASLGRLSASIAHEIRNPLSAISHAGQLLAESAHLNRHDLRLTDIIRNNSQRMNSIIENVLRLGRRNQAKPETVQLKPWLENFVDELCRNLRLSPDQVQLTIEPETMETEFDASQLQQILWNLCHNGIRHGKEHSGQAQLIISASAANNTAPHIDISDNGPGISATVQQQIFEPFFTTATQGSGLGLYIARELSECNHAHLTYLPAASGGSCFRLTFGDPRRRRS